MRPGGANAKGGAFERMVCRKLTKWITGSEKPEIFWRSATSGGKATQEAKVGQKSHMGGDLVCVHPDGMWFIEAFSIECKDRKSFGTLELMLRNKSNFLEWWGGCVTDALLAGKHPFMVFKRARGPLLLALRANINTKYRLDNSLMLTLGVEGIEICLFEDFLKMNDPVKIKREFAK